MTWGKHSINCRFFYKIRTTPCRPPHYNFKKMNWQIDCIKFKNINSAPSVSEFNKSVTAGVTSALRAFFWVSGDTPRRNARQRSPRYLLPPACCRYNPHNKVRFPLWMIVSWTLFLWTSTASNPSVHLILWCDNHVLNVLCYYYKNNIQIMLPSEYPNAWGNWILIFLRK